MLGRAGAFFLVTWPHVGARVDPVSPDVKHRLGAWLRRAGASPELLARLEDCEAAWKIRVAPRDIDGRVSRFVRRVALLHDGWYTDGCQWWDGSGRPLTSVMACSRPSVCPPPL